MPIELFKDTIFYGPSASGKSLLARVLARNTTKLNAHTLLRRMNENRRTTLEQDYQIIIIDECPEDYPYEEIAAFGFDKKIKGQKEVDFVFSNLIFITQHEPTIIPRFNYIFFSKVENINVGLAGQSIINLEKICTIPQKYNHEIEDIRYDIDLKNGLMYSFIHFSINPPTPSPIDSPLNKKS